ncbi:MAG: hypothetical protein GC160_11525 [Acidobacteria bacterium]|nr:hypothetical protein [Acidobacteriota bacterium]
MSGKRWRACFVLWSALLGAHFPAVARAQKSTTAVDCRGSVFEPHLDFEFRFFTGFRVSIRARELSGPERPMIARVRIEPLEPADAKPVELNSEGWLQNIPADARGSIEIDGSFAVGPGLYRIEWFLLDSLGHSCKLTWDVDAALTKRDGDVTLQLGPGEIADSRLGLFRPEKVRTDPALGQPLRVKVLLNLDTWSRRRAGVRLFEFMPRISALRAISRHPRIARVALVAFSVEEQQTYLRHGLQDHFDFPGLQPAIDEISPALISFEQLGKDKTKDFLTEILLRELPGDEDVDAYIFLGPDPEPGRRADKDNLAAIGRLPAPVFYLNLARNPWKGLLGSATSALDGKQLRYRDPRDLAEAINEVIEKIDARRAQ